MNKPRAWIITVIGVLLVLQSIGIDGIVEKLVYGLIPALVLLLGVCELVICYK